MALGRTFRKLMAESPMRPCKTSRSDCATAVMALSLCARFTLFVTASPGRVAAQEPAPTVSAARTDESQTYVIYVVGAVRKPRGYVLREHEKITVLKAVELAEGLSETATRGPAVIIRRSQNGLGVESRVNLNAIVKRQARDVELMEGDILFVPDAADSKTLKHSRPMGPRDSPPIYPLHPNPTSGFRA